MSPQLEKILIELASKLGTSVEHLWSVLIKQSMVSSVTNIIGFTIWFSILGWCWKAWDKTTKSDDSDYDNETALWVKVVWFVVAGASLAIFVSSISGIVTGFINPEFWALKQIVR